MNPKNFQKLEQFDKMEKFSVKMTVFVGSKI